MSFNLNIEFTINSWNSIYFILNNIIIMFHNLAEKIFLLCVLCCVHHVCPIALIPLFISYVFMVITLRLSSLK